MTGLLLMIFGAPETGVADGGGAAAQNGTMVHDTVVGQDAALVVDTVLAQNGTVVVDTLVAQDTTLVVDTLDAQDTLAIAVQDSPGASPEQAVEEAATTIRDLLRSAAAVLPKIAIAIALLAIAALLASLIKPLLRRALGSWSKAAAISALAGVVIWLVAISAALAVITGDARTLIGSVGLLGLALSWALQAPIESFSAWVLNSFREYYRVGDRISVGDVFGDVYRIDFLTTTVWEAGGPGKPVHGAQPTGALITFPNSEVLRNNITNYTRDFPYVWDELVVGVANESDLNLAVRVVRDVATELLGEEMAEPARAYRRRLERAGLDYDIADEPQVFVEPTDAWTNLIVRYLVAARSRRAVSTRLLLGVNAALAREDVRERVIGAYPVMRVAKYDEDQANGDRDAPPES